jgi:hypothetical protein
MAILPPHRWIELAADLRAPTCAPKATSAPRAALAI